MAITTVLFDLDGTLLPMDQDEFVETYFGLLAKFMLPHGYEPKQLIKTVWEGTAAMLKNDGTRTNEQVFWDCFCSRYGEDVKSKIPLFESFYATDFLGGKAACGFNPKAVETVRELKKMGLRVALATNPIFPPIATENRIRWAGLTPEDFEIYTTYVNSHYCKPSPEYYKEVADGLRVDPEECLMVGNDVSDDMPAQNLGMKVFLLTDCLINRKHEDITKFAHGSFDRLMEYIALSVAEN